MRKKFQETAKIIAFIGILMIAYFLFSLNSEPEGQNAEKADKEESNILKVSIITDIDHCPSRQAASEKNLAEFLSFTQSDDFDFVISLGDNASHRLKRCSDTGDEDARYIAEKIRSTGKPAYFVLGDHDIKSEVSSYRTWLETIQRNDTFYSFDAEDVHVVILDTVLGGEPMSDRCEETQECTQQTQRVKDLKKKDFSEYRKMYPDSKENYYLEKDMQEQILDGMEQEIKLTRSANIRDIGRIAQIQLDWLKTDLEKTEKEKLLIFSDHPLFPFTSERKSYDIVNGDKTREILKTSEKKIVCISGEAHLWHDEKIDGIQYYIVDEFKKASGSWATFIWDKDGYSLEKVIH